MVLKEDLGVWGVGHMALTTGAPATDLLLGEPRGNEKYPNNCKDIERVYCYFMGCCKGLKQIYVPDTN